MRFFAAVAVQALVISRHQLRCTTAHAKREPLVLSYSTYPTVTEAIRRSRESAHAANLEAETLMSRHVCSDYIVGFQGNMLSGTLRQHIRPSTLHKGGGKRGAVKGFSKASRLRAQRAIAKYDRGVVSQSLFITLTYPDCYLGGRDAKRDFKVFVQRLKRKYPKAGFFWRMEVQKRGAPHYHLLVFGLGFIPAQWIAHAWFEIVGSGDGYHLQAGTEIRKVRNYRQAVFYISKYVTKVEENLMGEDWGRLWGQLGTWRDYLYEARQMRLTRSQYVRLLRFLDSLKALKVRMSNKYRKENNLPLRKPYKSHRARHLAVASGWFVDADQVRENIVSIVGLTAWQTPELHSNNAT